MALLPVKDALARILDGIEPLGAESVPLAEALDRTLAGDLTAGRTQPPWDTSSMDGYAVRATDVASVPATLNVIGSAAAGHGFGGTVGPGEAARIFTGAPLPAGADTIVIQENTDRDESRVVIRESSPVGRHVRPRGLDFAEGDVLLRRGDRLGASRLALAAAMNVAAVPVLRRPVVAILATGDELVAPGGEPGPDQIVASNGFGVAAIVTRAGGSPLDLGIAPDDRTEIGARIRAASDAGADILVTLGGASVGEHDLVRAALADQGLTLDFWRIAMRPGKPLMSGRLDGMRVLGLPGNPVSTIVCSRIFLMPLIEAMLGRGIGGPRTRPAILGADMDQNDRREDYVRGTVSFGEDGRPVATPFGRQDSSMLVTLARAECLIVRAAHAPPARAGDACTILPLDD